MRNSKGISLLETVIASGILFFVIMLVLPQLYLISIERKNLVLENFARKTLNEKLFTQSINRDTELNEIVIFNRIPLELMIRAKREEENNEIWTYHGCIKWTDLLKQTKQKCGSISEW
ncbi:hypothetical protein [Bacillus sp. AK128]